MRIEIIMQNEEEVEEEREMYLHTQSLTREFIFMLSTRSGRFRKWKAPAAAEGHVFFIFKRK